MAPELQVTVAAITETEGRFLVVEERIKGRLLINQPAGHVERGETLLAAVVRETREETAWRFVPQALLGAYLWREPANGGLILRFGVAGTVTDHDATQPLDRGIVRTLWLTEAELARRSARLRSPLVLRCVRDYLAGQRQPLDCIATLDLESAASIGARTRVTSAITALVL